MTESCAPPGSYISSFFVTGINDAAAALVLTTSNWAAKNDLKAMARIVSWAHVGVDPAIMGIGPVSAVRKAVSKHIITL